MFIFTYTVALSQWDERVFTISMTHQFGGVQREKRARIKRHFARAYRKVRARPCRVARTLHGLVDSCTDVARTLHRLHGRPCNVRAHPWIICEYLYIVCVHVYTSRVFIQCPKSSYIPETSVRRLYDICAHTLHGVTDLANPARTSVARTPSAHIRECLVHLFFMEQKKDH